MIDLQALQHYFPVTVQRRTDLAAYMVKEYLQCQILEYLSHTQYMEHLSFIGGTNLRLIKRIDRFSEDLDFDCKNLSSEEFQKMTDLVIKHLLDQGYNVEPKPQEHEGLHAYRRSLYFTQLLFSLNLSGYKNAKFLIKLEMQDRGYTYPVKRAFIQSCGFHFPVPVPPDDILCAMKISALLSRTKGRDIYDAQFLLTQTKPNYDFLSVKQGITSEAELKHAILECLKQVDLSLKQHDCEHLLFDKQKSSCILYFPEFMQSYREA